jgi:hypothetical protein
MKKLLVISTILITVFAFVQCSILQTITNLSRLQFKLGNVNGFMVNNIDISNKASLSDLSPSEMISLSSIITQGKLPVSFVLNVNAKNPNDGTGGYARTDATLKGFKWRLFIDDKETISGDLDAPVTVPGTGEVSNIPLRINLDLLQFFKGEGLEKIANLVLSIGGRQGSSSRITLYATPTVSTPIGDIKYPGELKIVDTKFTN